MQSIAIERELTDSQLTVKEVVLSSLANIIMYTEERSHAAPSKVCITKQISPDWSIRCLLIEWFFFERIFLKACQPRVSQLAANALLCGN